MYAGRLAEIGPVDEVIRRPLHPYTSGLIGSIPSLHRQRGRAGADRRRHAAAGRHAHRLQLPSALHPGVRTLRQRAGRNSRCRGRAPPPAGCNRPDDRHGRRSRHRSRSRGPAPLVRPVAALARAGRGRQAAPDPEGGRRCQFQGAARHHLRRGRRERLRQVHAGQAGDRPAAADRRRDALRRRRHGRRPDARADDLPGPVCQPESALDRARHRGRADPHAGPVHAWGRHRAAGRPAAGAGGPRPLRRHQISAPVLGRPAAADLDRPRAGDRARVPGAGRADLGPRRLGAGAGPEPDGGAAARARPDLPVHQPQSGGHPARRQPRGGDVSGQDRRGGAGRGTVRGAPASLHAPAARYRAGHGAPAAQPAAGVGRGAEPDGAPAGLPVPSALRCRRRTLSDRSLRQPDDRRHDRLVSQADRGPGTHGWIPGWYRCRRPCRSDQSQAAAFGFRSIRADSPMSGSRPVRLAVATSQR